GHGFDLDPGLRGERFEEGLPPRGFPHAAVGIHINGSPLRARRADDRGRAEERTSAERQHPTAGHPSCHSPPRFFATPTPPRSPCRSIASHRPLMLHHLRHEQSSTHAAAPPPPPPSPRSPD